MQQLNIPRISIVCIFNLQMQQHLIYMWFFFLSAGLVKSLLTHVNSFIGKLNLLTTSKLGALQHEV